MSARISFPQILAIFAAIILSLLLISCGGSGGSGSSSGSTSKKVTGTATIPNSAGKNLGVSTPFSASAISGGSFTANVPSESLSLISVSDTDTSQVLLMGIVEPDSSTVDLNPANCAATLIFLGLGGSELKAADRLTLWTSIRAHATTAALATAIDTAMQADLYALENGSSSIKSALDTALAAQIGSIPTEAAKTSSGSRELPPSFDLIISENNGPHRGAIDSRQTEGFVVDNMVSRLEGTLFLYNTGYVSKDNTTHETNPERVGNERSFGAESTSEVIPLTLDSAFLAEFYDIIVLQPIFDQEAPEIFSKPGYSGQVAAWRASLASMYRRGLMKVTAAQMLDAFGAPQVDMTSGSLTQAVSAFSSINAEAAGVFTDAEAGSGLNSLVARCAAVPAGSEADAFSTLAALAPLLQTQAPELAQTLSSKSLTSAQIQAFRGTMRILSLLGSWEYSTTAGRYAEIYSTGKAANRSAGRYGGSSVEVLPPSGSFNVGTSLLITTKVNTAAHPNSFTYEYSLSNEPGTITNAVMNDGKGKVGRTITTTSPTCYLVTGSDSVGIADVEVTFTTTDSEGAEYSFTENRRYTPNGHGEFTVYTATPSISGPQSYDICSGLRIPKPDPVNGVYGAFTLKLWTEIEGDSIDYTNGNRYSVWNFPAYSAAPHPSSKSWEIVGQTSRATSTGTSSMSFGAYDYGDHILVVNWRGGGFNSDAEYKSFITAKMYGYASAVRSRYRIEPK